MEISFQVILGVLGVVFIVAPVSIYLLFRVQTPSLSLANARVLITGGSQGIGYEIARYCISKGASVILLARTQAKLDKSESDLSKYLLKPQFPEQTVATVSADVSDFEQLSERIDACLDKLGWSYLDALVCNAGIAYVGKLVDTPLSEHRRVMDINHFGCVNAVYACYKYLKKPVNRVDSDTGAKEISRIIVVSSVLGLMGMMCYSAYCSSKFAMRGFVESIRNEFASNGVYLGIVYPPDTNTEQYKKEKTEFTVPKEVSDISADAGLFEPEQVGADIAKVIETGAFTHPWGLDAFMLQNLHVGMGYVTTLTETYVQMFLIGIFRTIGMVYAKNWFKAGLKCMKDSIGKTGKTGKK